MNRPLRRIALGVLILLGVLLANFSYIQAFQADELNSRNDNARRLTQAYSSPRGSIIVGGQPIAYSQDSKDSLKYQRIYTQGPLYAPVTGYFSTVYGSTGIENTQNDALAGKDIRQQFRRFFSTSNQGKSAGGNVELTIDPKLQQVAAQALGNNRGAVVALDPSTGAILAMVTSPSYDPNALASHDRQTQVKAWETLTKKKDNPNPLLNRALREAYPPGSTFKLITAAAAIDKLGMNPNSEVPGPAKLPLPQSDNELPNWDKTQCSPGSDTTTLIRALEHSCNTTFASLGLQLKAAALSDEAQKFGFNSTFEIPMSSVKSSIPTTMDQAFTAQSAIGQQDVKATPLQMALVAAAIANNGTMMQPYLVSRTTTGGGGVLSQANAKSWGEPISDQTASMLRQMMIQVVAQGTGTKAQVPGFTVAGKTGTAQWETGMNTHSWFVGFAPAGEDEQPTIALAVFIEGVGKESTDPVVANSQPRAAPVAQQVLAAKLQ